MFTRTTFSLDSCCCYSIYFRYSGKRKACCLVDLERLAAVFLCCFLLLFFEAATDGCVALEEQLQITESSLAAGVVLILMLITKTIQGVW